MDKKTQQLIKRKYYSYRGNRRRSGREYLSFEDWCEWFSSRGYDLVNDVLYMPYVDRPLARKKFSRHRAQAKYRGIEFEFDFETWDAWWSSHGIDKNQQDPRRGGDRPCMCRYGDEGPYHPNNVYLADHSTNTAHSWQNPNRGNRWNT